MCRRVRREGDHVKIEDDVLGVISRSLTVGPKLALTEQVDRALYVRVDKVLQAMGGRWDRKAKAHVFEVDAAQAREDAIVSRKVVDLRADYDFFPTPAPLAKRLVEIADVIPGMRCLEPSAGKGAIAGELAKAAGVNVDCVELADENVRSLSAMGYVVHPGDFLTMGEPKLGLFERIVMNPPFSSDADTAHIAHAFTFLRPGGVLVSVASAGVTFRQSKRCALVRAMAEEHGSIEPLPDDSFKESGTRVRTVVVRLAPRRRTTKRRVS